MRNKKLVIVGAAIMVLAFAAVSNAQMGVGVKWETGIPDIMTFPIMFGEGMVLQPMLGFESVSDAYTEIEAGVSLEKHMREGTTPLFGGYAAIDMVSPDEGDSWTNFGFGVFVGGSASLADNVDLVGQWGPSVTVLAEEAGDATIVFSNASLTLRWWLWGE